jgi:hypothetical protein
VQAPEDRAHVVELKVPVLLVVNVTVPVGVTAPAPEESATVAVQVVATPVLTDEGLHTTVVVVDLMVDASVNVPLLPVWTLSPLYVPVMSAWPTTVGV